MVRLDLRLSSRTDECDRPRPLNDYCAGLLPCGDRRKRGADRSSTSAAREFVQHQRLLHFVAEAPWSDEPVLAKVREPVVPAIERHGPCGRPRACTMRPSARAGAVGAMAKEEMHCQRRNECDQAERQCEGPAPADKIFASMTVDGRYEARVCPR